NAGESSGRGNHDGSKSSAQQNQTTSVSPASASFKEANPWRGRKARQTAGRGAGTAQAGSESRSCPTLAITYAACLILKSSIRLPDFSCAASQRGFLPRPAQVSDGRSGFRYFGTTAG